MLANDSAGRSLRRIAETLWMQLRAIGPLTQRNDVQPGNDEGIAHRVVFTRVYFQLLEQAAELRFEPGETPLLYNTAEWPDGAAPAGWLAADTAVKPSDLVISYHGMWRGHLPEHDVAMRRFLKATLWVIQTSGFTEGLRYLFALHRCGFAVGPSDFGGAVGVLLGAYRAVERDEDVPRFFFGRKIPATPHDLIHADFVKESFGEPPPRRPLGEDVLATLFDEAQMQIDRVRGAADYDEWLVGQCVLYGVAWIVEQMLEEHGPKNLGIQSFIDQLEELRADAGSQSHFGSSFSENLSALPRALSKILAFTLGVENARQHVLAVRAPFPPALADLVFEGKPLPPPWNGVSPRLAGIHARLHDHQPTLVRTRRFTREELEATDAIDGVFAAHPVDDPVARENILREVTGETPQTTEPAAAKPETMNPEQIKEVAGELRHAAAVAEHRDRLIAAIEMGEEGAHAVSVEAIRSIHELYPWSSFVHYELGIALDRSGDPESALHHIETAIALAPARKEHWQSLGVVLNRLGARHEAVIAKVVGTDLITES